MKNAIIIHGTCSEKEYFSDAYPSLSNSHWLPWLQKQLLIKNIPTQTPEMPEGFKPDYEKWSTMFERFDVNEETTLIGHSSGAGFLLKWLSENKVKVKKLILVAPWLDPEREATDSFFDFEISKNLNELVKEIHVLVSQDDDNDILKSVSIIKNNIPVIMFHEFLNYGHFTSKHMGTDKFPELLNYILE